MYSLAQPCCFLTDSDDSGDSDSSVSPDRRPYQSTVLVNLDAIDAIANKRIELDPEEALAGGQVPEADPVREAEAGVAHEAGTVPGTELPKCPVPGPAPEPEQAPEAGTVAGTELAKGPAPELEQEPAHEAVLAGGLSSSEEDPVYRRATRSFKRPRSG